jgi:hypothetical protein
MVTGEAGSLPVRIWMTQQITTRQCVGCDAELPPPVKDRYAIQLCGVCGTEQPHVRS